MPRRRRLKGLSRAVRVGAVRLRSTETLSREAEERIFRNVEVLSEGAVRDNTWFGSTMITVDLERLEADLREALDEEARQRLLRAVEGSVRVRIRAMRLARLGRWVLGLAGVPRTRELLHFRVQRPSHLRQCQRNQRLNQLDPRIQLKPFNDLPTHLRRLTHPPILLASLHQLWHASHRWPPSSLGSVLCFPHPPYLRSEVTSISN